MKKMTVRLSADIFDYCKSYGQVIERFEVISLFTMDDDKHSEVCKFTIREGVPVDQIQCNYVSNLIVLQNKGREYTCLVKGHFPRISPGSSAPMDQRSCTRLSLRTIV